jgi:hypothetical protein
MEGGPKWQGEPFLASITPRIYFGLIKFVASQMLPAPLRPDFRMLLYGKRPKRRAKRSSRK